jgi:Ser/Thr protein kinase RdoA (MazF antagonist)
MQDSTFFLEAIAELYKKQPLALHPLHRNNPVWKRLYRVDFTNETSWVLRAYHRSFVDDPMFHLFSRYSSLFEWLQTRATLLVYLTQQRYPAPAMLPCQTGALIGIYQEWYLFMTTFVEGDAKEASPEKMQQLGAALGYLHTLPPPEAADLEGRRSVSWWEPDSGIAYALNCLDRVAERIPEEWNEASIIFRNILLFFQERQQLAKTITHADCWAENGLQTQGDIAMLIDWECAGLGLAIIDIGSLLLYCHFDQFDNPEYHTDAQRIAAVIDGYCRKRQIPPNELEILVEAVRFNIAWRGAWTLGRIEHKGWHERLHRFLTILWRWYALSEEIVHIAYEQIEHTI